MNNYIYNPGGSPIRYNLVESEWEGHTWDTGRIAVVGNVLQYGANTDNIPLVNVKTGPCEVYMEDNIAKDRSGNDVDEFNGDVNKIVATKPVWHDNIETIPANGVKEHIIELAGARPWDRDETDTRIINAMLLDTSHIIDYETEVGGFPVHIPTSASFYEEEWNMDYMIRISPDIEIVAPDSGACFLHDSIINVEVDAGTYNRNIHFVELLVNDLSEGKDRAEPYTWDISRADTGMYTLTAIAEGDSAVRRVSCSVPVHVSDSIATFLPGHKTPPLQILSASCYPNPFNHTTTLKYTLLEPEYVTLTIYNAMGQRIHILASEFQTKGTYSVSWHPDKYPAGIYFYSITAGKDAISRKLIYQK